MEKTVKIGNRKVRLKANAMLPLLYREYFGEEIFKVQMSIFGLVNEKMEINLGAGIDTVGIMKMIWCMAKAANPQAKPFREWVEEIGEFPVVDIIKECMELLMVNMTSLTKIKNAGAAES